MNKATICIVGKDKRQDYLASYLASCGFIVRRYDEFSPDILPGVNMLIGPVTFYRNNKLLPEIKEACIKEDVSVLNYMACEDFLLCNAKLTAEGFLVTLIQNTPFTLNEADILLLGLGRCGNALNTLLSKLDCKIDAYDTVEAVPKSINSYNVVINTIPNSVISEDFLRNCKSDCIFFDIASAPGGYDKNAIDKLNLTLINCPGIPGKTAPMSAGYAIGQCVLKNVN